MPKTDLKQETEDIIFAEQGQALGAYYIKYGIDNT